MVARVSTYAGPADRLAELARGFEQSADAVRELDGFEGAYLLEEPAAGTAMTVALWSTREAAEKSAKRIQQLRREAAERSAHSVERVEVYDVAAQIPS